MSDTDSLSPALLERVLEKLGHSKRPGVDLDGLRAIYKSWCSLVPFDNSRKLIHKDKEDPGPMPGNTAEDYFEHWLKFGTGGTCWAGNGALFTLLHNLGFTAYRGVGTMMVAPDIPPNHGTVVVEFDGDKYLVDASILHVEPLLLQDDTNQKYSPWVSRLFKEGDNWNIQWRPLHRVGEIVCRIDYVPTDRADFHERHEKTRLWSPFNYELNMRLVKNGTVTGIAEGTRAAIKNGEVERSTLTPDERITFLIDEMGLSEEFVRTLPPDRPTPPPPWSRTAQENA